jgi:hypothetical protein
VERVEEKAGKKGEGEVASRGGEGEGPAGSEPQSTRTSPPTSRSSCACAGNFPGAAPGDACACAALRYFEERC